MCTDTQIVYSHEFCTTIQTWHKYTTQFVQHACIQPVWQRGQGVMFVLVLLVWYVRAALHCVSRDQRLCRCHRTAPCSIPTRSPLLRLAPLPLPLSLSARVSLAPAGSLCGGVCTSSWCVSCAAARCCSVMATVAKRAAGHAHTHPDTHRAHAASEETLPRDSLFIPLITISPVSYREGGRVGVRMAGVWPVVSPQSTFQAAPRGPVARFHFHQTRKCRGSVGLSLNLQLLEYSLNCHL